MYVCDICNKTFAYRNTFLRHYRSIHEKNVLLPNETINPNIIECAVCCTKFCRKDNLLRHLRRCQRHYFDAVSTYTCAFCYKTFSRKSELQRHIGIHSREDTKMLSNKIASMKCALCENMFSFKYNILDHIMRHHGIQIDHQHYKFTSKKEFNEWRMKMQESTNTSFRTQCIRHLKRWSIISLICHRSGSYEIKSSNRKRRVKRQGSKKLGTYCPAEIIVQIYKIDGSCKVSYISTHLGHNINDEKELVHIYPTKMKRADAASKMDASIEKQILLTDNMPSAIQVNTVPLYYQDRKGTSSISKDFEKQKINTYDDAVYVEILEVDELYTQNIEELYNECFESSKGDVELFNIKKKIINIFLENIDNLHNRDEANIMLKRIESIPNAIKAYRLFQENSFKSAIGNG